MYPESQDEIEEKSAYSATQPQPENMKFDSGLPETNIPPSGRLHIDLTDLRKNREFFMEP
jgi:hypothetical protein